MENTSVTLNDDLLIEILLRMPLKSLVKCTCASKKMASLIRSKEFRDRYLVRSMKMPRLLFIVHNLLPDVLFHSVYQEEEPLLSSGQQQTRISVKTPWNVSHPIRGLICMQEETKVTICNLGAKKFHTLPKIQAQIKSIQGFMHENLISFFGCDKDGEVFKVLCMTKSALDESEASKQHQVLTVLLGEEAWRPISCEHLHCPVTQGLCKEGVLYYGARSKSGKYVVMSFNVMSVEFTVIELPERVKIHEHRSKLVIYNGNIALVHDSPFGIRTESNGSGFFAMLVRDEGVGTWSNKDIKIPYWKETVGDRNLFFKGTIGTEKLVFATKYVDWGSWFVLYYDNVKGDLKLVNFEAAVGLSRHFQDVETLLDHVDSPWLI